MTIKTLVEKYNKDRENYISSRYNETLLRSDFLDPMFELLGWDIKNSAEKPTNDREVLLEEPLKADVFSTSKKPDYTFRLFSERKFFLEAKKPSIKIENNDNTAKQVRRYGFTGKLKISILSNFEYLMIYDCSVKVEKTDSFSKALIKTYHYSEYEEKFDEIKRLLSREGVYSGDFDKVWADIEQQINLFSVDTLFLEHINSWRIKLGNEIYKQDNSLSEEQLNDYVQSYINSIIFLRVCEDRNLEDYQTLLNFANEDNFEALIRKFNDADKKYNSGLFEQYSTNEIIQNLSSVFWEIIRELYYPESPYSFSVFASDILGNIYEIFLAETLHISESNTIELIKKPENTDRDIVTTPTYIVNDILRETIVPFCENKTEQQLKSIKISDIACGSGAFLLESFQLLNDILIDFYKQNDPSKLIHTSINSYKLPFKIKKELLKNCIYGVDKDYNAVEAAKFGLLLKLLENEDNSTVGNKNPILPELSENLYYGNSLISQIEDESQNEIINPFDFGELKFDIIVGNPPYLTPEAIKKVTPLELPIYKKSYQSAYMQFDKYFLFIERALDLLTEKGLFGFIVPSKFTKVGAGKKLREILTSSKKLKKIVSFGANQLFQSKTTYTCLLFLSTTENTNCEYYEVNKLKDWKIRDFSNNSFENIALESLNSDVWVLVPSYLKNSYNQINSQSTNLSEIVGEHNISNGIQTSANQIYIIKAENEDDNFVYFKQKKHNFKIEKSFLKPYFATSSGTDNLNTYRPFSPNRYVLYPYKSVEDNIEFIKIDELKRDFPFAYKYLIAHQDILANPKRDIKPIPETTEEWYRYGRHQSLETCDVPTKIIVGVLSQGNKYAIDYHQTLISSGGTAGYCMITLSTTHSYSIYYIQAILNSKYLEWYSTLLGEVFRGGYIARGTKVLKKLPIRIIDFENTTDKAKHDKIADFQRELIELQGKIDKNSMNKRKLIPLQRQFLALLDKQNQNLKQLYNLDNDNIIPSIKELYAAN